LRNVGCPKIKVNINIGQFLSTISKLLNERDFTLVQRCRVLSPADMCHHEEFQWLLICADQTSPLKLAG
jgi:hypothetical protein